MILVFGEILFDLFPDIKRLGGAPFNFAYHLKKMGFPVRFVSRVANDVNGKEILDILKENNFNTEDIQIDDHYETGIVKIEFNENNEHIFDIVKNVAYDYLDYTDGVERLINSGPDLIYFGTLFQRSNAGAEVFKKIQRAALPKTVLFCDLNLRSDCYDKDSIKRSIINTDILKINNIELEEVFNLLFQENDTLNVFNLLQRYNVGNVIITKGEKGSCWINNNICEDINTVYKNNVVDTVGAGDAFAAVVAAGYLKKLPVRKTLELSSEFASHICTVRGALPESDHYYNYIKKELEIKDEK